MPHLSSRILCLHVLRQKITWSWQHTNIQLDTLHICVTLVILYIMYIVFINTHTCERVCPCGSKYNIHTCNDEILKTTHIHIYVLYIFVNCIDKYFSEPKYMD
jgi:hypothetical protein